MLIEAPISVGELLDKISILEIKLQSLLLYEQQSKFGNIHNEQKFLLEKAKQAGLDFEKSPLSELYLRLSSVNQKIWDGVARQWELEKAHDINTEWSIDEIFNGFRAARAVLTENDKRAQIKREINKLFKSAVVEEKVY